VTWALPEVQIDTISTFVAPWQSGTMVSV
jgi:hypothetical protein